MTCVHERRSACRIAGIHASRSRLMPEKHRETPRNQPPERQPSFNPPRCNSGDCDSTMMISRVASSGRSIMRVTVKYGGKQGREYSLEQSTDMIVVRSENYHLPESINLSAT